MRGVINGDAEPPFTEETVGERALLTAVLYDGIESLVNGPPSMDRDRDVLWYHNNDDHIGGFVWYCDLLELDVSCMRSVVDERLRKAGKTGAYNT